MVATNTPRRGPGARLAGISLLALSCLGCHRPSTKLPAQLIEQTETEAETTPGQARERLEPLPVQVVSDLFPAETLALGELSDPVEYLGMFAALDQIPEFNSVRGEARAQLGVDLLDPQEWAQVGLDSGGAVGFGALDIESAAGFAYATLSDPQAFEDFILRIVDSFGQRERISIADVGEARVIRFGDELSVVLRAGFAVAVFVDRPSVAHRDYVALVATIDPREALSRTEGFAWVRERLDAEDDGLLFVSPPALLAQIEREMNGGSEGYGVSYAQDELDSARKRGAPAEELREYERRLEEERSWQAERDERDRARLELVRRVVGSVGAGFIAADIRDAEFAAHGAALMPGPSLLRDVFVPVSVESPLYAALDESPLALLEGRVDMQTMRELSELLLRADGEDLVELSAEFQAEFGVDPLAEIWPAFDGSGGIALTEHAAPNPAKLDELPRSLGIAAHLGLSDPKGFEALLGRIAKDKRMRGVMSPAQRGTGWTLSLPDWHALSLSVVGDQLVLSSDPSMLRRVESAKPGKQAATLQDSAHIARGPYPTPAMRMYQRLRWVALAEADTPWEQDAESMLYDVNVHPQLSEQEAAEVPRSRDYKRKYAELERAVDELNAFNRKQAAEQFERQLELADKLGELALQLERRQDGLAGSALWRMAPGTSLVGLGASAVMAGFDDDDWRERERLNERCYQLAEELHRMRTSELDAAASKQGR